MSITREGLEASSEYSNLVLSKSKMAHITDKPILPLDTIKFFQQWWVSAYEDHTNLAPEESWKS